MRFRTTAPMFLSHEGRVVEPGTLIGDDTDHPCRDAEGNFIFVPSPVSTPIDDEAKQAYQARARQRGDAWGGSPEERLPIIGAGQDGAPVQPGPRPFVSTRSEVHSPMMELTHPSDLQPGEAPRLNPVHREMLDREMEDRERRVAEREKAVEEERRIISETRRDTREDVGGVKIAPASTQVPRNTGGVTPESDTGAPKDLSKEASGQVASAPPRPQAGAAPPKPPTPPQPASKR